MFPKQSPADSCSTDLLQLEINKIKEIKKNTVKMNKRHPGDIWDRVGDGTRRIYAVFLK